MHHVAEAGRAARVWGSDVHGRPFNHQVSAVPASSAGEWQVWPVPAEIAVGEVVGATIQEQRCRARVVACEIAAGGFRLRVATDPAIAPAESDTAKEISRGVDRRQSERRAYPRLAVSGTVFVGSTNSGASAAMKFTDISLGGCYVETFAPAAVGAELHLRLQSGNLNCQVRAIVRVSHPQMGMGVQFASFNSDDDRENLICFLNSHGCTPPPAGPAADPNPLKERLQAVLAELKQLTSEPQSLDSESYRALEDALAHSRRWLEANSRF